MVSSGIPPFQPHQSRDIRLASSTDTFSRFGLWSIVIADPGGKILNGTPSVSNTKSSGRTPIRCCSLFAPQGDSGDVISKPSLAPGAQAVRAVKTITRPIADFPVGDAKAEQRLLTLLNEVKTQTPALCAGSKAKCFRDRIRHIRFCFRHKIRKTCVAARCC